MKAIAILLTVFNRKRETLICLQNLFKQELPDNLHFEIYLTNDGCTDGTPEAVKLGFPNVHIINGDGNLFWNRGMYTAWKEAARKDYDYYLWLNDDTFVYSNMLSSLLKVSIERQDKAIIVGATRSLNHSIPTYGGRLANGKIPVPDGKPIEVGYFNGNIVLIPRFVYQKLGNLDYYFTHSKGDFDYGLRAKKSGIEMFQVGEYLGECDLHETIDKWCNPAVSFRQRWKMLHRPNGMPPKETLHFEKRHYGLGSATFHYCTIYLRCLFPTIWIRLRKV